MGTEERADHEERREFCALPPQPVQELAPNLDPDRRAFVGPGRLKWANGTVLHYYFFDQDTDGQNVRLRDGSTRWVSWVAPDDSRDVVRKGFEEWKGLGLGLQFKEVDDRRESEVRIGFMLGDRSWSGVGRQILDRPFNQRTMNFGWDVKTRYGKTTVLHEIGHTLGLEHEHQNPFAGIVWDEEAVYREFAESPNQWDRATTYRNVLEKLNPREVEGSPWDPASVMEYDIGPGLILQPPEYRNGIAPPGTISAADTAWALKWYPSIGPARPPALQPFESTPLDLKPAEQVDFSIDPPSTRSYTFATFGSVDTLLALFEEVRGELRFLKGDDDSGEDRNARFRVKLFQGRHYVLRLRLYWAWETGTTSTMYW
jgi:Astacin (Peptidase family M12A)